MEKIAIIGLSCLFPGATTPTEYWQNLLDQKYSVSAATANEMGVDPHTFYASEKGQKDKYYSLMGGFVRDFTFDPHGYNLPPEALQSLDTVFQWPLYVAQKALADSGYLHDKTTLAQTGLILGNLSFPTKASHRLLMPLYHRTIDNALRALLGQADLTLPTLPPHLNQPISPHNILTAGYPAAIVMKALGLGAAHLTLDAACASALYSVKLACEYLLAGKATVMLAGALSAADPIFINSGFSIFHAYPEDGVSKPLDQASNGLVAGEGAGMFVLKRYQDALRDDDKIYAVIRGIGLSNDGRGKHLLSPNPKGQTLVFERAYTNANITPQTIPYVECHATGTPLGDLTELNSMADFFTPHGVSPLVGSSKSNLGHMLTNAGMAGMTKLILSMAHDVIPATVRVDKPHESDNQVISSKNIVTQNIAWPTHDETKHGAVSAFGFGGTNAHIILESANKQSSAAPSTNQGRYKHTNVAIIGMDAFFGGCSSLADFKRTIYEGEQHFIPLPEGRWKGIEQEQAMLEMLGFPEGKAPQGAYIDSFDMDFLQFRIPPNDTDQPDPQQLLILKVVDNALRDAGFDPKEPYQNVAVLIGMGTELSLHQFRGRVDLTWQLPEMLKKHGLTLKPVDAQALQDIAKDALRPEAKVNQYISYIGNIMAARISAVWDFSGPSFTISAEENSAFRALEVAQMLLATSEVDAVVVGAVDLAGGIENVVLRQQLAPGNSGHPSMSLDQQNNGWLVGEGAGAVVLKREDQATQAQDKIYAVIETVNFARPNQSAYQQALSTTGRDPAEIGYLELSASGLAQQDSYELQTVFDSYNQPSTKKLQKSVALGSVKANIGHTFAAAGIASLIKTALCLHQQYLPGVPGWSAPKQMEQLADSRFYIPTESRPWLLPQNISHRVAAINSISMEGSHAHVILSEAKPKRDRKPRTSNPSNQQAKERLSSISSNHLDSLKPFHLFLLTGANQAELVTALETLQQQLDSGTALSQLAWHYFEQFEQNKTAPYTISIIGGTPNELKRELRLAHQGLPKALTEQTEWQTPLGSYFTPKPQGRQGEVAFVYPGAFNGYLGMGRELNQLFPEIYNQFGQLTTQVATSIGDQALYPRTLIHISDQELKQLQMRLMLNPKTIMSAGTSYSIMISMVLHHYFGVQPKAGLGYSLGEFTMMWALGVWQDGDTYNARSAESDIFETQLSGPRNVVRQAWGLPPQAEMMGQDDIWGSFVIKAPPQQVQTAIANEPKIYLTHINTPTEVVIAGDPIRCQQLIQQANFEGMRAPFNDVLHCDLLNQVRGDLVALNTLPVKPNPAVRFYSTSAYQPITISTESAANSMAHCLCTPVDFPRLINQTYQDGVRIFVELGPRATCTRWINGILAGQDYLAVAINKRGVSEHVSLVKTMAQLASHRVPINLSPLYQAPQTRNLKPGFIKTVKLGGPAIQTEITKASKLNLTNQRVNQPTTAPVQKSWWSDKFNGVLDLSPHYRPPTDISTEPKEIEVNPIHTNGATEPPQSTEDKQPDVTPDMVEWYTEQREQLSQLMLQANRNHALFLKQRHEPLEQLSELIQTQIADYHGLADPTTQTQPTTNVTPTVPTMPLPQFPENYSNPDKVVWDERDLLEFAGGDISKVFGDEFKVIDGYPKKVRLPLPPYLLVSRITELDAKVNEYKQSFIQTEYDIPIHGWYCTDGQAPSAVAVESGQCDLMLISYLGIDFQNKSDRVYRLLDCTLTFMDDLPVEGQTLRYDITIDRFAKTAGPLLFFFRYNCYVGDKLILKMRGGCAGFFTQQELDDGKGVIYTDSEVEARNKIQKSYFEPPLRCEKTQFNEAEMKQLCRGEVAEVFGSHYAQGNKNPSLRLPPEDVLMVDRIAQVDRQGGLWGLGMILGEKIIEPDHWYFPCHFKDDEVLAGSLIAEGCVQLLEFYLLYLGMQIHTHDARFQPIQEVPQVVRCRGETTPCSDIMTYRLEITELGLEPAPYAKANVEIHFQGRIVVDFQGLSLQLKEKEDNDPYAMRNVGRTDIFPVPVARRDDMIEYYEKKHGHIPGGEVLDKIRQKHAQRNTQQALPMRTQFEPRNETISKPETSKTVALQNQFTPHPNPIYTEYHIEEFAMGKFENAFGPDYHIYDQPGKRAPRTPNGPLKLISRITEFNGERRNYKPGSTLVSEYDVPVDAWWYEKNSYPNMPYSILMEIALQPCGFLSACLGSTFVEPETNYYFRNLDGHGTILQELDLRGKTVTNHVTMTSCSIMGMIIQKFDFELSHQGEPFYRGFASFGYFTAEALANQIGLDQGRDVPPWHETANVPVVRLNLRSNAGQALYQIKPNQPHYRLLGGMLNFLDEVLIVPDGGEHGQGYIYASKIVNPPDWFYKAHFHEDPVMPGSLGVEAILQAMQTFALQQDLGASFSSPYFEQMPHHKIIWKYRGQIIQANQKMYLDIHINRIEKSAEQVTIIGKANLWRDNMRIYEVTDIALCIRDAG